MTYDEMRRLNLGLDILPSQKLLEVMEVIQHREPNLRDSSPDEMVIDFYKLKPSSLWALDTLVTQSLQDNRRKDKKCENTGSSDKPELASAECMLDPPLQ